MTTPTTDELLNRYLDGDLDPGTARSLEERLEREPALRRELDELAAVRRLVGNLATETAPPRLDHLADPLRLGPPPHPLRPVLRALATAAVLVIGAGVILETVRRETPAPAPPPAVVGTPSPVPHAAAGAGPAGVPTPREELLGAVEHLMATPPPPPPLPEPPILEPVGPLPVAPESASGGPPRAPRISGTRAPAPRASRGTPAGAILEVSGTRWTLPAAPVECTTADPVFLRVTVDASGRILRAVRLPGAPGREPVFRALEGRVLAGLPAGTHDAVLTCPAAAHRPEE